MTHDLTTLQVLLATARPLLRRYGYFALAGGIAVEGFGIPAPGQTLLIGAVMLAGRGELNLPLVLIVALASTMTGDNLGFLLGRHGGRRLVLRLGASEQRLSSLARFYQRHGVWPLLLNRFFDGTRQAGSIIAGAATMPWRRFFILDCCGAVLWVGLWSLVPYQLEEHAALVHAVWHRLNPIVLVATIAALVALGVWLWRPRR